MRYRPLFLLLSLPLFLLTLTDAAFARLAPTAIRFAQDTIHLPLETRNDRLFVTVTIDDQDYRFLFDTGALTVVSESLATRHKLDSGNRIRISDSNNKKQNMGFCDIPELQLAELFISNLPATLFPDDNPIFTCLEVDGILGSNAFFRTAITIDTHEGILSIYKAYPQELPHRLKLNNQNGPYLVTKLGDQEMTFFFDSGSAGYGEISKSNYKKTKRSFTELAEFQGIRSWGAHGFAKPKRFKLYATDNLAFSDAVIPRYPLVLAEENTIGAPLLRHGILTLDFENRRWGFQAISHSPPTVSSRVSITPLPIDGHWEVGAFDRSVIGVQVGDEVIAIEGIDLNAISLCDIITGELKDKILNKTITIRTQIGDREHVVGPIGLQTD